MFDNEIPPPFTATPLFLSLGDSNSLAGQCCHPGVLSHAPHSGMLCTAGRGNPRSPLTYTHLLKNLIDSNSCQLLIARTHDLIHARKCRYIGTVL